MCVCVCVLEATFCTVQYALGEVASIIISLILTCPLCLSPPLSLPQSHFFLIIILHRTPSSSSFSSSSPLSSHLSAPPYFLSLLIFLPPLSSVQALPLFLGAIMTVFETRGSNGHLDNDDGRVGEAARAREGGGACQRGFTSLALLSQRQSQSGNGN